jgi:hypothetical protein
MNIPLVKKLVETYALQDLKQAESDLYDENPLSITVDGEDAGEQLTHILAAIWINEDMNERGVNMSESLREYTRKVRTSIS